MKTELDEGLSAKTGTATDAQVQADRRILCRRCASGIAKDKDRVVRNGSHRHLLMNKGNYVFDVACFADAPGCRFHGSPTFDFTWFPGFAWSYADCRACGAHLGWRYDGTGPSFVGLIMDRLVTS
jgi:hypothetical protein